MNNEVCNERGHVIGFRCYECRKVVDAMWGETCNECREKERRHNELLAAQRPDCATGKAPVDEQQYDYEDRHAYWFNSYMLLVSKLKLDVDYEPADTFPERVEKALGDKFSKAAEAK